MPSGARRILRSGVFTAHTHLLALHLHQRLWEGEELQGLAQVMLRSDSPDFFPSGGILLEANDWLDACFEDVVVTTLYRLPTAALLSSTHPALERALRAPTTPSRVPCLDATGGSTVLRHYALPGGLWAPGGKA
jgi:hypothetical protein